ncbi:hypothetical protein [Streptomyces sp. NPDC002685]|uniref:hypothetical protein n=1 Tax=Streptomyces sp. NPDC002685 TaxID=3154540 RepID=UPI003318DAA7
MTDRPDDQAKPQTFGYEAAMKEAFFIAAPLFTAASLSLAGVVAGADDEFLLPGLTLLLLVASSLILIAAIQLNYHARQYFFTHKDVVDRLAHLDAWRDDDETERNNEFERIREAAHKRYMTFAKPSVYCFNLGVLLLGLGIGCALAPPPCGQQTVWRWIACSMVLAATAVEGVWIWKLLFGDKDR